MVQGQNIETLVVHVETDSNSYSLGTTVTVRINGTNRGTKSLVFDWPTSCVFDFEVTDSQGNEVFGFAKNVACAQVLTQLKIEPGETRSYNASWNQISNVGSNVGPGEYHLTAWLVGQRSENMVTFHLVDLTATSSTTSETAQTVNEFVSVSSIAVVSAAFFALVLGIALRRRIR